ncbi:glycoprotein-N-acetylgalactosamine 3-beta-galactosyltransferase 1-like isoform X2 [Lineus longissimus]|uniref:glycoprotein-N-acetylgalactosamine 3-beta-galactosyltransferase 1-like isoform X2 n=1 Tax=Lineus longissimus TaxID=88925 RepID=UPI002B4DDE0E
MTSQQSIAEAKCSIMRLTKLLFLGGLAMVMVFIFSSRYLVSAPKRVQWIAAADLAQLFIPQKQEMAVRSHQRVDSEVSMADALYKKVRILCWIMTAPKNLEKKAKAVYDTWAKRCNIFLFMSSESSKTLPNVVALDVSEGRDHLTMKTMKGFQHAWDHYQNEADWFMKADDDTFVIVENLRYLLAHHSPESPVFFGHHFKTIVKQGYMSGGAGYVLSKEALRRVVTTGIPKNMCRKDHGAEDVNIGDCLEKLGVKPELSIDTYRRESFHPFNPGTHVGGGYPDWYYKYTKYGSGKGKDCCSEYSITFHYIDPNTMYMLEFLVYGLKTFGVNEKFNSSLVNSLFQHDKKTPYIQTVAVLPTKKPESAKSALNTDKKVQMEKIKDYLAKNNIKVVQKAQTQKPGVKLANDNSTAKKAKR